MRQAQRTGIVEAEHAEVAALPPAEQDSIGRLEPQGSSLSYRAIHNRRMERQMFRILRIAVAAAALTVSAGAYADDPTGILLQERHQMPRQGHAARFSDLGPCQRGTQSVPFPNGQGFRCVRR
jgi:hypothetical protein